MVGSSAKQFVKQIFFLYNYLSTIPETKLVNLRRQKYIVDIVLSAVQYGL